MITLDVYTISEKLPVETEEYNPVQLNESLNNGDINTVLIGNTIIARLDVRRVVVHSDKVDDFSKKVRVLLRNGESIEIPVSQDFDIKFLNSQLNSSAVTTVLIGLNIYQKFEVVQVVPVAEEIPVVPINPPIEPEEPPLTPEQLPVME